VLLGFALMVVIVVLLLLMVFVAEGRGETTAKLLD
jgi:hypothetical protein